MTTRDESAVNTDATTPARPAGAAPTEKIRGALLRYRILAWITGLWLLVLSGEMVYKYLLLEDKNTAPEWFFYIAQAHGVFYMIYLVFTVDLGIKARWEPVTTALTCLAGTVPFLSFWFEHKRTLEVRRTFGL